MSDESKASPDADVGAEVAQQDDPPPSAEPALAAGELVGGEYVIDRLVAAGGMAQVFAAHHALTQKVVAIKTSTRRLPEGSLSYQRMIGEARALGEIDHPNVVRIYHTGRDPKVGLFIVMELLEGKNLRQIMRWSGGIPVPDALAYAIEIAEATHALHGLGIFHRDIKPENVFVTKRRVLKLLDLGAAKVPKYGNRTTDNMGTVGTVTYMSPEHLSFGKITAASDVYSLGVMTYEMLARRHVFLVHRTSATPEEFRQWHLMAPPEPLNNIADVTELTSKVVARALEKDPANRYQTMAEFAEALEAALRSEVEARRVLAPTVDAPKISPVEELKKGKFGTDLMVPQLNAASLKQAGPPAGSSPGPALKQQRSTIKMETVTSPSPSPVAQLQNTAPRVPDARALAASRGVPPPHPHVEPSSAALAHAAPVRPNTAVAQRAPARPVAAQVTPSPVTLDDGVQRSGPKIAMAVFAGLIIAVIAVLLVQLRTQHAVQPTSVAASGAPEQAVADSTATPPTSGEPPLAVDSATSLESTVAPTSSGIATPTSASSAAAQRRAPATARPGRSETRGTSAPQTAPTPAPVPITGPRPMFE